MTLEYDLKASIRLVTWLSPYCERLEVAGSIRRQRPTVNDIDLVAIPRITGHADLFGADISQTNLLWQEIMRRCAVEDGWILERGADRPEAKQCTFTAKGVQVDIWTATPETWGTVLLCRTGSKEHNIWLADRAKRLGGHWNPHQGITLHGQYKAAEDESSVYEALGLAFIPPAKREAGQLVILDTISTPAENPSVSPVGSGPLVPPKGAGNMTQTHDQ